MLLFNSLLEMLGVSSIPLFVTGMASPEQLDRLPGGNWSKLIAQYDSETVLIGGAVLVASLFFCKNSFSVFTTYLIERYSSGRHIAIGTRLFHAYHRAPLEEITGGNTADIIRNVNGEARTVSAVVGGLMQLFVTVCSGFAIAGLMALSDPIALAIIAGVGVVIGGVYALVLNPQLRRLGQKVLEAKRVMIRGLTQAFQSTRESRVMGFWPLLERQVDQSINITAKAMKWQKVLNALANPFMETASITGMLILVVFLAGSSANEADLVAMLTLFAVGLVRLRAFLTKGIGLVSQLNFSLPSLNEVYSELVRLNQLPTAVSADQSESSFSESIEFRNITYKYPQADEPSVANVTVKVQKGETVGFAGTTGAGKTTLINVILGLLQPQSGEIRLDGVRLESMPRLRTGYVPQYIYLIDGTLRENVAVTLAGKAIDDSEVWRALQQAQLAEFVRQHPDGLNMHVGENGSKLSGGQRQRLGIARALFHKPEILVLDEGTSALDVETEEALMNSIHELHGKMTILLIAHRLSTLEECDRVITMENGRIVPNRQSHAAEAIH